MPFLPREPPIAELPTHTVLFCKAEETSPATFSYFPLKRSGGNGDLYQGRRLTGRV